MQVCLVTLTYRFVRDRVRELTVAFFFFYSSGLLPSAQEEAVSQASPGDTVIHLARWTSALGRE